MNTRFLFRLTGSQVIWEVLFDYPLFKIIIININHTIKNNKETEFEIFLKYLNIYYGSTLVWENGNRRYVII